MGFLIDPYGPSFWSAWRQSMARLPSGARFHLLVDAAFKPEWTAWARETAPSVRELLFEHAGWTGRQALAVSPILVDVAAAGETIEALVRDSEGYPMLSAFITTEPLAPQAARLSRWCVVRIEGMALHLRFADSRRLPDFLACLDDDQRAAFLGPVTALFHLDRQGGWSPLPWRGRMVPPAEEPDLRDEQVQRLLADAEADEWLAQLPVPDTVRPSRAWKAVVTILQETTELAPAERLRQVEAALAGLALEGARL